MKNIHPFPAKMAPDLAIDFLNKLDERSTVLDPMVGSGTVIRQAVLSGHHTYGFDLDPLAKLITQVGSTKLNWIQFDKLKLRVLEEAQSLSERECVLPWIDDDAETSKFIDFWFLKRQKMALRKFAYIFKFSKFSKKNPSEMNALRIAFSRLIITKKRGASVAWDISHSRPHKVKQENDFNIFKEFSLSADKIQKVLKDEEIKGTAKIYLGDARKMTRIKSSSIDAIITSPPYLNAIDYLRGHKFSLIWLGYKISEIRAIRGVSIGAEKKALRLKYQQQIEEIFSNFQDLNQLQIRNQNIIKRYIDDAFKLTSEMSRVLRPKGVLSLVIGDSCLQNIYVENSSIFVHAANHFGLKLLYIKERELPLQNRYLPLPKDKNNSLNKRMKKEKQLNFVCP